MSEAKTVCLSYSVDRKEVEALCPHCGKTLGKDRNLDDPAAAYPEYCRALTVFIAVLCPFCKGEIMVKAEDGI